MQNLRQSNRDKATLKKQELLLKKCVRRSKKKKTKRNAQKRKNTEFCTKKKNKTNLTMQCQTNKQKRMFCDVFIFSHSTAMTPIK